MNSITERIEKLSEDKIDELFYSCGWIDSAKGNNEALPDFRIEEIRKAQRGELISTFIEESNIEEIKKNLERLEND